MHQPNHKSELAYHIETLEFFVDTCRTMESTNLRLGGKILATLAITAMTLLNHTSGDVAAASIAAIWVVTIPSLVEAWVIAKKRQRDRASQEA